MLILVSVISGAGQGGVQTLNRLILDACRDHGLSAHVHSLLDPAASDWMRDWPDARTATGSKLRFVRQAIAARKAAKESVILVTHLDLVPVGRMIKRLSGGRLACFLLGVEAWQKPNRRTAWGLRGVDEFVSISGYTWERFQEIHPKLANRQATICHLAARQLPVPEDTLEQAALGGPRVLVVGRLWGRGLKKGQTELISVWPRIVQEFPQAQLWIAGGGQGRAGLEQLAAQLHVQNNVRFWGEVDDAQLARLYRATDVFAMPSQGEGFGLVFAEAMSFGLPCIASRDDAGREVVLDEKTGLLVHHQDPEQLTQALLRLLRDSDLRARLGKAGQARVEAHFTVPAFQQRMIQVLAPDHTCVRLTPAAMERHEPGLH